MTADLPVPRTGATDREVEARRWLQIELDEGGDYHVDQAIRWALGRIAELEAGSARAAAAPDSGKPDVEAAARRIQAVDPASKWAKWDDPNLNRDHYRALARAALLAEQPGGGR